MDSLNLSHEGRSRLVRGPVVNELLQFTISKWSQALAKFHGSDSCHLA